MKENAATLAALERRYEALRQSLAQIGYLSQGSVLDRSQLKPKRSGYQWTRKVAQKTTTVSLSPEQFQSMKQAVANQRKLWMTVEEMEKNIPPDSLWNSARHSATQTTQQESFRHYLSAIRVGS